MFKDPAVYPDSTHRGGWGFSAMGGSHYERGLRREEFGGFDTPPTYKIGFTNRHKLGGGFYFLTSDEKSQGSVSTTLGFGAAGLDVTGGVFGRWYFTVSGSFLGGGQLILQNVVHESPRLGLALGISGRVVHHWAEDNQETSSMWDVGPDQERGIFIIGPKALLVTREKPLSKRNSEVTSFSLFVGYVPEYSAIHISGSMSYGAFKRRKKRKRRSR